MITAEQQRLGEQRLEELFVAQVGWTEDGQVFRAERLNRAVFEALESLVESGALAIIEGVVLRPKA